MNLQVLEVEHVTVTNGLIITHRMFSFIKAIINKIHIRLIVGIHDSVTQVILYHLEINKQTEDV